MTNRSLAPGVLWGTPDVQAGLVRTASSRTSPEVVRSIQRFQAAAGVRFILPFVPAQGDPASTRPEVQDSVQT